MASTPASLLSVLESAIAADAAAIATLQESQLALQKELAALIPPTPRPLNRVFSPTSFWYQPIPVTASIDPNSAAFVQEFQRQVSTYYGNVNLNTDTYAAPVYYVKSYLLEPELGSTPASMPIFPAGKPVNVIPFDCQHKGWIDPNLTAQFLNVPIPAGAITENGTDKEMCVYDLDTKTLYEFWVMQQNNGQWEACWGGSMTNTEQNEGIFQNPYGATATGLPLIGGEIKAEELETGEINHVIGIALVDTEVWYKFSWPANRSDGYNPNNAPNRITEGTRFRLDPTLDVTTLGLTPIGLTIAKAAQKYGFVVWDKGGAVAMRLSNPAPYTLAGLPNPYTKLFNGIPSYAILNNFPWAHLQFMPQNYGKPA